MSIWKLLPVSLYKRKNISKTTPKWLRYASDKSNSTCVIVMGMEAVSSLCLSLAHGIIYIVQDHVVSSYPSLYPWTETQLSQWFCTLACPTHLLKYFQSPSHHLNTNMVSSFVSLGILTWGCTCRNWITEPNLGEESIFVILKCKSCP